MADKKPPGANEDMYGLEAFRRALRATRGRFYARCIRDNGCAKRP